MSSDVNADLDELGRCWFRQALPERELQLLEYASAAPGRPGARLNWNDQFDRALGSTSEMSQLANRLMPGARAVRLVSFDKTPSANWSVPWHQDRVIAAEAQHDVPGYSNWSRKADVWHAEPPIELLRQMIFARVHFDETDEKNGCMEIALGSHKHGYVPSDRASKIANLSRIEQCRAKRGDVLFVRALILHRSESSRSPVGRHALRVDYASSELPDPLSWAIQKAN